MSNPEIGCAISLAEAMHIPVITASPIDEFQQKSYLISVAYRKGFKLRVLQTQAILFLKSMSEIGGCNDSENEW